MSRLVAQLLRFGAVGGLATGTHVAVVVVLVEAAGRGMLGANALAFAGALAVSYGGNRLWTFRSAGALGCEMPRFLLVALVGLALNQAIVYATVERLGWDYRLALLLVVLVVPATSFALNREWVFARAVARASR